MTICNSDTALPAGANEAFRNGIRRDADVRTAPMNLAPGVGMGMAAVIG